MSKEKHEKARGLAQAFRKMEKPANRGGTGGTFTAAATKAGHADTPEGRKAFADKVLSSPDNYSEKMVRKANFYRNVISKGSR
jgi:hypothetical protein